MKEFMCTVTLVIFISLSCTIEANTRSKPSVWTPGMDEKDEQLLEESMIVCNESFRTSMEFFDAIDAWGSFPDETDKTPKCFLRCILEKTGLASEDGVYDIKMTARMFAGERDGKVLVASDLEEYAKSCGARDENCMCERAYEFTKCMVRKEMDAS